MRRRRWCRRSRGRCGGHGDAGRLEGSAVEKQKSVSTFIGRERRRKGERKQTHRNKSISERTVLRTLGHDPAEQALLPLRLIRKLDIVDIRFGSVRSSGRKDIDPGFFESAGRGEEVCQSETTESLDSEVGSVVGRKGSARKGRKGKKPRVRKYTHS
jgi:hypothetical protein